MKYQRVILQRPLNGKKLCPDWLESLLPDCILENEQQRIEAEPALKGAGIGAYCRRRRGSHAGVA